VGILASGQTKQIVLGIVVCGMEKQNKFGIVLCGMGEDNKLCSELCNVAIGRKEQWQNQVQSCWKEKTGNCKLNGKNKRDKNNCARKRICGSRSLQKP
jgi:hypothetical protein